MYGQNLFEYLQIVMENEGVPIDTPHSELPGLFTRRQRTIIFQLLDNFWQFNGILFRPAHSKCPNTASSILRQSC